MLLLIMGTQKIVQAMAESINADLIDITKNIHPQLDDYDIIGLSSGIYFHYFYEGIKICYIAIALAPPSKHFWSLPVVLIIVIIPRVSKNYWWLRHLLSRQFSVQRL